MRQFLIFTIQTSEEVAALIKTKYITVPKNKTGIDEYNQGIEGTDNLEEFILPESEYENLDRHKVFDIINEQCNLMIDLYESETVTSEQLKKVYPAISLLKGTWLNAVNKAIEYNTCLYLDF